MANTSWSGKRTAFPPRIRRLILTRQPECATGCGQPSTIADHIINHPTAIRAGWTLEQYHSPTNGQGLCEPCHTLKTRDEQAEGRNRKHTRLHLPTAKHPGQLG